MFTLDYIRLERSGEGRNKAQVTSGSGRSGGQDAGEVILSQQDQIKFWEVLGGDDFMSSLGFPSIPA